MNRRRALRVISLGMMLTLAACGREQTSFSSIDMSGADFGHDFHLTDPAGKERSLAEFRGKMVMLFFGFTQCPYVCPTALARAAEVRKKLGVDGDRLQVIFVTIDPERDTPAVLKAYTAAFDPSFLGLYADIDRTKQVADAFRIYYRKIPTGGSYTMDHTSLTYVFDRHGRLRLTVQHELSAEQVAADLRLLLQSDSKS